MHLEAEEELNKATSMWSPLVPLSDKQADALYATLDVRSLRVVTNGVVTRTVSDVTVELGGAEVSTPGRPASRPSARSSPAC